jgi:hypothetical protein
MTKMGLATFWATFSQSHLATLLHTWATVAAAAKNLASVKWTRSRPTFETASSFL